MNGSFGIYDMVMSSSGTLYIGGAFSHAGGFTADGFAYLAGGHWYPLGDPGGIIHAIAIIGSGNSEAIYVGGDLGGLNYCCIARWNRNTLQWDYLMDSVNTQISPVTDMETYGSDLYISGVASLGSAHPSIIKWNGSAWSSVGTSTGVSGCTSELYALGVKAITISGSDIYAGGCFGGVPGLTENVDNIAKWNTGDSQWLGMNGGMNGTVTAIAVRGSDVYVGGSFSEAGGIKANHIAKWDGSGWSTPAGGVNDAVRAIAISPDGRRLYAGGAFTLAGGTNGLMKVAAKHIATLDLTCHGCAWQSLGTGVENGLDDDVLAIAVNNTYVYVGGAFSHAGTHSAPNVARWSLGSPGWSGLAGGLNDTVYELALSGNDLYAGGSFTQTVSPVTSVSRIARWNALGGVWSSLGYSWSNGVNGTVYAIAISGSNVYVGGLFSQTMGISAANIAVWNGGSWSALGGGLSSAVTSLTTVGTKVYAGGSFGGHVAFWDGTWLAMGSGIGNQFNYVYAMGANSATGDVYAGGLFSLAGGKSSRFIALYHGLP